MVGQPWLLHYLCIVFVITLGILSSYLASDLVCQHSLSSLAWIEALGLNIANRYNSPFQVYNLYHAQEWGKATKKKWICRQDHLFQAYSTQNLPLNEVLRVCEKQKQILITDWPVWSQANRPHVNRATGALVQDINEEKLTIARCLLRVAFCQLTNRLPFSNARFWFTLTHCWESLKQWLAWG